MDKGYDTRQERGADPRESVDLFNAKRGVRFRPASAVRSGPNMGGLTPILSGRTGHGRSFASMSTGDGESNGAANAQQPSESFVARQRRRWRSRARHRGLRYWIPFRGLPVFAFCALVYGANATAIGWRDTYDVAVGITSPADTSQPVLAWVLSVAGWLLVPGIAGAVAGYVVTTQIEDRRQRPLSDLLQDHTRTGSGADA
jgi:hypothetical protein